MRWLRERPSIHNRYLYGIHITQISIRFFSSFFQAKKLEQTIERSDRKTLQEWYEYTYDLNDLIRNVEKEAKKCGCTAMYEPILDSKQRIDHGFNAISNKLQSE